MKAHPPIADLVDRAHEPDILDHIGSCASCRARSRLLAEIETTYEDLPGIADARRGLSQARERARMTLSRSIDASRPEIAQPHDLEPGRDLGRYVVESLVGRGGMGTVYRVRHRRLDSLHALKVLHRASHQVQERLVREGRAQSRLRHPYVVPVTDIIDVDGAPGLIMEFVDGPTLHEHLCSGPVSIEQADRLGQQIIRAVVAAHEAGIIHRDIKPANVLLLPTDEGFVAKVADFGLARQLDREGMLELTDHALGTPSYMAPEQIRDPRSADERSDMFAVGALLYEMLTGHRAFGGLDVADVFDRVRAGSYSPLPEELPARMRLAITRALEVEPRDRFRSCRALLEAWRGEASPSMTSTFDALRPPSAPRGLGRIGRPAAALGVLGLVMVLGLAFSRHQAEREAPGAPVKERRLTALASELQIYDYSLSQDGETFAFVDGRGLHVQSVEGGSDRLLLQGGRFHNVDLFPDGQRLLVAGILGEEEGTWTLPVSGGEPELLVPRTGALMRLSPDGDRVAIVDQRGLGVLEVATRRFTRIRPLASGDLVAELVWSPSGEAIATVQRSATGGLPSIDVTAADGSSTRRLIEDRGLVGLSLAAMDWIEPDILLYNVGRPEGSVTFALFGVEAGKQVPRPRLVHEWPDSLVVRMRATPDGRRIAYSRATTEHSLRVIGAGGESEPRRLSQDDWAEYPLGWRDGRLLVYSERGRGGIYSRTLDGSSLDLVHDTPDAKLMAFDPSTGLYVTARETEGGGVLVGQRLTSDGTTEVFRLTAYSEESRRHPWYMPKCSQGRCMIGRPVGERLDFVWIEDGDIEGPPVYSLELSSRYVHWALSPDATRLAVITSAPGPSLIVRDLRTGEIETHEGPIDWPQELAFGPDGATLFVSGLDLETDRPYHLLRRDPDGTLTTLDTAMSTIYNRLTPSPDGTLLAYGLLTFDDDLWLVEGIL